jgi:hypothetical protein
MPVGSFPMRLFPPNGWVERFDLPFSGTGKATRVEVRNGGGTVLATGFTEWENQSAGKLIASISNNQVAALNEAAGLTWRLIWIDTGTLVETVYIEGAVTYSSRANLVTEPDISTILIETPPTGDAAVARLGVGRAADSLFALAVTGAQKCGQVALASGAVNCAAGNIFTRSVGADITFSFSNVPAGDAYSCTIVITYTAGVITWPAAVKWPGGVTPTPAAGVLQVSMLTLDGGTIWRADSLQFPA